MKILNISIFFLLFIGCNNKSQENKTIATEKLPSTPKNMAEKINTEKIKKYLILQEKVESDEKEYDNPYNLTLEDLKLGSSVINYDLSSNGYTQPKKEEFNGRIKLIFSLGQEFSTQCNNFDIDNDYITLFGSMMDGSRSTLEKNKYDLFVSTQNIFIDLNGHFIHPMFLLKELINIKNDNSFNTKTPRYIIARNMYLFNDNKAQYKWLILNDQYFMESLVKTFGYTEDSDLLKWVIERTKFDKNNPQDYGKLFWIKNCDGTLKLHANTFKVLQTLYQPNDNSENRFILDNIQAYLEYLGNLEDIKAENISEADKVKIMANLTYFAEQYKYNKNFNSDSKMMGRLRFFLNDEDIEILKKNNYFNLPKFKEWLDNADYDEYIVDYNQVWGRDNEPMNYNEWRKQHPKT